MNRSTTQLGYDPCDLYSFPYQEQDPPFDATSLQLEDLERAACTDPLEAITTLLSYDDDGPSTYRTLDMALRLFVKLVGSHDNAFDGVAFPDIFGAALDQALIWEHG